VKTSIYLKKI